MTTVVFPRGRALRLVILDCDGVLFHSWDANVAFYDSVLTAIDHAPLDEAGRELCHRLSGPQLWSHLFRDDAMSYARAKEAASRADYSPFYALMHPMPGLLDTLERLSSHCPLALATNRGRTVAGVLAHFGLERYFTVAAGILDVPRPKPAPDLLLTCLERTGVHADAAIYVGDTSVDHAAAKAAGVAYVGVGPHSGALYRIRELQDLPDLLDIPMPEATAGQRTFTSKA